MSDDGTGLLKLSRARKARFVSTSHARAPKMERELASKLAARVTKGSGNKMEKGDVRVTGIARIECKTTFKKSFGVTREMLEKVEAAGYSSGELPALVVEFRSKASDRILGTYAVVPYHTLEELVSERKRRKS